MILPNSLSTPVNNDVHVFENAAVGHQLGVDRNDMVAPGKLKKKKDPL